MKRKNLPQPNPQQLLDNLQHRKSQHQKLSNLIRQSDSLSKPHPPSHIISSPTSYRQPLHLTSNQYKLKKHLSIRKGENRSLSSTKNQSLKNIYCKTLTLSPHQKKKSLLTPKSNRTQFKEPPKYHQLLDMFITPDNSLSMNEMIKSVNKQISTILQKYSLDSLITQLFERIKETIGVLLETCVSSSISMFSEQERVVSDYYKHIIEENQLLKQKITEFKYDNRMLEEDFKRILRENEELAVDLCERIKRERNVNDLIYGMRLYGIDVDLFYSKMKHPEASQNQSQQSFTSRHLSQATI